MSYIFNGGIETNGGIKTNNVRSINATSITINSDSTVIIENTTASVNSTSGALQVVGGVGVSGNVFIAQGITVTGGSVNFNNGVSIDMGNNVINNVASPILATDVANKNYVDSITSGLNVLQPVVAGAVDGTSPVNLGATFDGIVIDGVTLSVGDRVLVTDQSADGNNPSTTEDITNGLYLVETSPTPPSRTADLPNASNANDIAVLVQGGTVNAGFVYIQTQDPSIVGTDPLLWIQLFQATSQDLQAVLIQGNTTGANDINVNSTGRILVNSSNTPQIISAGGQALSIASDSNTNFDLTAQGTGNLNLEGNNVVITSPSDIINFVTSTQTIGFNPNDNALTTTAQNVVDAINEVQSNGTLAYTLTNISINVTGSPATDIGFVPFDVSELTGKTAIVRLFADFSASTGATLSLDLLDNTGSSLLGSATTATTTGIIVISGITLPVVDSSIRLTAELTVGSGAINIRGSVIEFS